MLLADRALAATSTNNGRLQTTIVSHGSVCRRFRSHHRKMQNNVTVCVGLHRLTQSRMTVFRIAAAGDGEALETPPATTNTTQPNTSTPQQYSNILSSVGLALIYLCFIGYAATMAPDQTPARDTYFLKKCFNLITDSYQLPTVWTSLFTLVGLYPLIFGWLLNPTARSANKVPIWPFVTAAMAAGALGLMPYFILWQPTEQLPPTVHDQQSVKSVLLNTGVPVGMLALALWQWGAALTAGSAAWSEYFRLFDESRLAHVTTLDFLLCTVLAPFWMWNDAQVRGWEPRDKVLPVLSLLPVVGPAMYLLLRPKNY